MTDRSPPEDRVPSSTAMRVPVGSVLRDKYRVERVLGEGGMAVVVEATHLGLAAPVAVKVLSSSAVARTEALERFFQEARTMATLASAHVVRVLDVDRLPTGEPYLVMEKLTGRDLGQLLEESGPVDPDTAAAWVLEACEGVAEAHARGIVHRDLKPSNLFLAERAVGEPIIKVCDFGIAKLLGPEQERASSPHITTTQQVVGSPAYMAPEQIRTPRDVDFRADLWALGVILHELISGKLPHEHETVTEILAAICMDDVAPLSSLRSSVPPELDAIVARCLQRDPADRYGSAMELASALREFLRRRGSLRPAAARSTMTSAREPFDARPIPLAAVKDTPPIPLVAPKPLTEDDFAELGQPQRRRWYMVATGAAVLLLLVAILYATRAPSSGPTGELTSAPSSGHAASPDPPPTSAAPSAEPPPGPQQDTPPPARTAPTPVGAAKPTAKTTGASAPPPATAAPPATTQAPPRRDPTQDGRTAF